MTDRDTVRTQIARDLQTPRATYRLQLCPTFTFADAAAVVPYLAELGVSHVYLSPVLQAAEGSTHGYDVVDPDRASAALGGDAEFAKLVEAVHAAGLAILLDIVPNHMAIGGSLNRWWLDVLENGPASYYAHFFDVDWGRGHSRGEEINEEKILLPILGERYGRALTSGTLALERTACRFQIRAHDHRFPVSPRTLGPLVRRAGDRAHHTELQYIGDALSELPPAWERDPVVRARRHRDKHVLVDRLATLCATVPHCEAAIADEVAAIAADPAELDALLEKQNYRLAFWQVAGTSQLRHRRFFDITNLVGLRAEDPDVFAATHGRVLQWLADGSIAGVRIDHVDGLRAPSDYLRRLRDAAPHAWIVVEKILGREESLPPWPIDGTTGYEYGDRIGALLVDPASERALTDAYASYVGEPFDVDTQRRRARHEVMSDALRSELERVTDIAARACAQSPACRDFTRPEIGAALAEILAGYDVYRTYLGEDTSTSDRSAADRVRIAAAVELARIAKPDLDPDLLAFLAAAMALELPGNDAAALGRAIQQVTGALVAKGDEDTLSYRLVRLLARCEVGADLAIWSLPPARVHALLAGGSARSLLATSTHDTKRAEDVRARIAAISEVPDAWIAAIGRWRERSADFWRGDDDAVDPDRGFEYALWQTLVGAWPIPEERVQKWAEKATREARVRTSWRHPDASYEAARGRFVSRVFADATLVEEIAAFARVLQPHGDRNALAQLLVKLTAPGVPDLYQGTELRDDSLVDPDNRRAIDFALRRSRLREIVDLRATDVAERLAGGELGIAKLFVVHRTLAVRKQRALAFEHGYTPLVATGPRAEQVFAFVRGDDVLTCVPLYGARAERWRETTLTLPAGTWRDAFGDREWRGTVDVAALWQTLPVALLVRA